MNELFIRQSEILLGLIADYRSGKVELNSLIQKIEGIRNVVGVSEWSEAIFQIVLNLEQINAEAIEARRTLTKDEADIANRQLVELEMLGQRLGEL